MIFEAHYVDILYVCSFFILSECRFGPAPIPGQ